MKIAFVIILLLHSCLCKKDYTNYTLFRTLPANEKHLEFVKRLSSQIKVDFWRSPGLVNKPVDLLINPDDKKMFMRTMEENKFDYTTVIDDVQSLFNQQIVKPYVRRKMETFDWTSFFSLKDIYAWMNDLEKSYPGVIKVLHLGKTYEGREILGLKLILNGTKTRSAVIIEGGIHAREWASSAFVTYFLNQLVLNMGHPRDTPETVIGKLARTYEFYFIPVLNPDGYEFSMKGDRMWRKNRSSGYGVDINRNFDAAFGQIGVSSQQSDEIYCGPHAFSEKESQAVRTLTHSIKDKLEYYIAFHSYGQYMIIPYAHLKKHSANYNEMYGILRKAADALKKHYNTKYTIGTAFDTVGYRTSGVSGCWAKKTYNVPYVVTFELRDEGKYGFALPPNQIIPTCLETTDAVLSILKPKTLSLRKIGWNDYSDSLESNKQARILSDYIVIFFNISFFIILRFY